MNCARPYIVKQTGGIGLPVPCGNCMQCRIARRAEWTTRLMLELAYWPHAYFITLTYEEAPEGLQKKDLQDFWKRLRKKIKLKHYSVGEYGEEYGRPHYHAVVYSEEPITKELLLDTWKHGIVKIDPAIYERIRYCAGYITDKLNGELAEEVYQDKERPFALMSKKLGLRFAEENKEQILTSGLTIKGTQVATPRYYLKKLENDEDKKKRLVKALEKNSEIEKTLKDEGLLTQKERDVAVLQSRLQKEHSVLAVLKKRRRNNF